MYCGDEVDNYYRCVQVNSARIYLAAGSCHTIDEGEEEDGAGLHQHDDSEKEEPNLHSKDTLAETDEAQMSSCCEKGEEGMKEEQLGSRRTHDRHSHDTHCTTQATCFYCLIDCSSFSYKQGSTPVRTQRSQGSTLTRASRSSFSHSINQCMFYLASSSSGASGSTSTIPFSQQRRLSLAPPRVCDYSEQGIMPCPLGVDCKIFWQEACTQESQDCKITSPVSTFPQKRAQLTCKLQALPPLLQRYLGASRMTSTAAYKWALWVLGTPQRASSRLTRV